MSRTEGETAMSRSGNAPDPPTTRTAYRRTMFDRFGPDAALALRAVPFAVVTFVCMVVLFAILKKKFDYPGLLILPLAAMAAGAVTWAGMRFAHATGARIGQFIVPTGDSTPYEHQFSREDALAARGDFAGALESLEAAIASTPITAALGVNLRIRAAELYIASGIDVQRAAELFREVQRFPGVAATQDIYVSNRLIDLLLGTLRQPARALFELRRIADRYPNTTAATHARAAIATVKRQIAESNEADR